MHREYMNPYPAKLVVGKDIVYAENANKSHGNLQLQPDNFTPFPKKPVIARVFKEIGRADELGSGIRNIYEYFSYYSSQKPIFEEKDIFKCTIFLDETLEIKNTKPITTFLACIIHRKIKRICINILTF